MVVNAGQRREMGHLNLVAVRHRKRSMVGRVTAVEERLALVERKLRGEVESDDDGDEVVSEEPPAPKDFRLKIVCGEDKRLMLVPLGVEVAELEAMVEKELNLGISFTLKVVMNGGNVVPLTSRDILALALADTGWISRPSTSAISARKAEQPSRGRGRSRDAKTVQMLVYTMVDKEREEAEAAVEAANKEREEMEEAEREHARELAEAEEAEAEAERLRLEAEAAAHRHSKEEEEAQAAEEEALAKEELAEEALA